MMQFTGARHAAAFFMALTVAAIAPLTVAAQPAPPAGPPPTAQAVAPLDLTGYWVAVVTEDWQYRMVIPDQGDLASVPLNAAGRKLANSWDPVKDAPAPNQCKAYGAPAIMRVPERLHITWANPQTLKVETDAGRQTRLFHFDGQTPSADAPSLQGYTVAMWQGLRPGVPAVAPQGPINTVTSGPATRSGAQGFLKVSTSNLTAGYLRMNGVPYSADAAVDEYLDSFREPDGTTWLVVTTIVTDPTYLARPFVVSSHFKKEATAAGWHPSDCGEAYKR